MEYKKNLWDNTTNEESKFRTKNWVEINDESEGTYNMSNQIEFKTLVKSNHIYVIIVMYTYMLREL